MERPPPEVLVWFRKMGAIGGSAKVKKGFSKMDPVRVRQLARIAAEKRWHSSEEKFPGKQGEKKLLTPRP